MSDSSSANKTISQTSIHIMGGLFVALLMGIALGLAPYCGKNVRLTQIRSIQGGAQADLLMILDKEKTFRDLFGTYTSDLNALGVNPKIALYKVGFTRAAVGLPEVTAKEFVHRPEIKDYDALKGAIPKLDLAYSPVTKLSDISITALESFCSDCTAYPDGFKAIAAANLDADADLDLWTIDHTGTITHLFDDLK